jgi:group I intron endonuclease
MRQEKVCGIYRILNKLNNKFYIGSSIDIYKRWYTHKNDLTKNKHHAKKLQRAWNKYGESHFSFEILETCEPIKDTLILLEQKYLDLNPCYNSSKVAINLIGYKHSDDVNKWNSERQIGDKSHRWDMVLSKELRDKIKKSNEEYHLNKSGKLKIRRNYKLHNCVSKIAKPVVMIDVLTNEILKEFPSIMDAARFIEDGHCRNNIRRALRKQCKTAYGYKWRFKNDL